MSSLDLKLTHKPVQNHFAALRRFDDLGVSYEGAVNPTFRSLLDHCVRQHDRNGQGANAEARMSKGGRSLSEAGSIRNSRCPMRAFTARRSTITAEIGKVVSALASQSSGRAESRKKLERFCLGIEKAAATIADFLNVAKACFRHQGDATSALQNELQVLAVKAVFSAPTNR